MIRSIIQFSVKNSLFVNLISVFILVAGILSLFTLRREAFPNVEYDVVMIQTNYFGSPPEEIEKLITIDLEDELKEISGIDEMSSVSSENISLIIIKLDPDEKNKDKVVNDIQRAVDRVTDLPNDLLNRPLVQEIRTKNQPMMEVALSGPFEQLELQKLARQLEIQILNSSWNQPLTLR